jgi:hypothetical protein
MMVRIVSGFAREAPPEYVLERDPLEDDARLALRPGCESATAAAGRGVAGAVAG